MSSIFAYSILIVILAIISSLVLYLRSRSKLSRIETELKQIEGSSAQQILALDAAIARALIYLGDKRPIHEKTQLEATIAEQKKVVQSERASIAELSEKFKAAQADIDKREAAHNALREGREEAALLAEELRTKKEEQLSQHEQLQTRLLSSQEQMNLLAQQTSISSTQQQMFKELATTLNNAAGQLKDVVEVHTQTSQRFLNLQLQYEELEKEYRKLLDIEISGK